MTNVTRTAESRSELFCIVHPALEVLKRADPRPISKHHIKTHRLGTSGLCANHLGHPEWPHPQPAENPEWPHSQPAQQRCYTSRSEIHSLQPITSLCACRISRHTCIACGIEGEAGQRSDKLSNYQTTLYVAFLFLWCVYQGEGVSGCQLYPLPLGSSPVLIGSVLTDECSFHSESVLSPPLSLRFGLLFFPDFLYCNNHVGVWVQVPSRMMSAL